VIRSFADRETEKLFRGRRSKAVPQQLQEKAVAKLLILNAARDVEELRAPPGNHLERLHGDRKGQWSIRINVKYRICFVFEGSDAYEVEVVDYH
jgi:proteic killer suppression protein